MASDTTNTFDSRQALAKNLAQSVAETLQVAIASKGSASLAVSGGSTPKRMFQNLSQRALDWSRVTVTLVDDRCVPANHERSNQRFVRENLLQNAARDAHFLPLIGTNDAELLALTPFDVCLLGMGTDGHTASFFPGGDTLSQAVDAKQSKPMIQLSAEGAGEERVTLTLPFIVTAKRLILHIEGAEKRTVLAEAQRPGDPNALPIRHVLLASDNLEIFWTE